MMKDRYAASMQLLCADGRLRKPVRVGVGRPYQDADGVWCCPLMGDGMALPTVEVKGQSELQALCLAIALLEHELRAALNQGTQLFFADDDPTSWDIEALNATFGKAVRDVDEC